ncbi:MAG TPA: carbohydrate ABC transporter permease [Thermotogaceae bacterium]|nr:carbohydrate ABC transporter permease [Thermotogota bacterium]HEW91960.1 carbohydrate ABC transporter permease [Thermotogaceae bacterium]
MNNLSKVITKRTNKEKVLHVLEERLELIEYLKTINAVYNRATTQLNIIKGPKIIKDVSKEGDDTLRITFDKVRSFWFEDESFKMKAEFSFKETLLNLFQNYLDAWKAAPFSRYYFNTIFVSLTTTVLEIIFASMAAFAFAKLNFFGKNIIFLLFLSTMMVPGEVLLVPNYITLAKLGWLDTYYALIIPWTVSVFAIFLIRQHFLALPNELYDAAKMDGCSDWKFLWEIMVPLSKPVIITAALLKFVSSWNSFLWVLIVTKSPEIRTLPVGLLNFSSEVGTLYNQLMAASTFSVLPVIIVFLFAQKYFIRGISRTGLK